MLQPEDILSISSDGRWIQYADQGYLCAAIEKEPAEFTLMLFSGRFAKWGVEVYEGDIIAKGASVEFSPDKGFTACGVPLSYHNSINVIGNIYENQELMEPPKILGFKFKADESMPPGVLRFSNEAPENKAPGLITITNTLPSINETK